MEKSLRQKINHGNTAKNIDISQWRVLDVCWYLLGLLKFIVIHCSEALRPSTICAEDHVNMRLEIVEAGHSSVEYQYEKENPLVHPSSNAYRF